MNKKKLLIGSLMLFSTLVGGLCSVPTIVKGIKSINYSTSLTNESKALTRELVNKRTIGTSNNKLTTNQRSTLQGEDFTLNDENAIDLVDGNVSLTTSTSICAVSNGTIAVVNNRLRFINPNGTIKWTYSDSNIGSEKGKIISTLYMPAKNAVAVLAQDAVKGPGYAVILLINIDNGKNLFYQSVAFPTEDGNDGGLDGAIIPVYGAQYGVQSFIVMPRRFLNLGERSKYSYLVNYYPTTPIVSQMEIDDELPSCIIGGVAILGNEPSPGSNIQPTPTIVLIKQITDLLDGNSGAYLFANQYSSSIESGKYKFESIDAFNYYEKNNKQVIKDSRDLIFMNPRGAITRWNDGSNNCYEFNIPINFTHNGIIGNTFRILSGGWSDTTSLFFEQDRCISFTNADSSTNLDIDVPYVYVQDHYVYGFASYARINGKDYHNSIFRIKMLSYSGGDNLAPFTQEIFNKYNGDNTNERFRVYKNLTPSVGIPVPSYANQNDYIYFFENNKAQMKVINPVGGNNNAGSYAYVTELKNSTFDFSKNEVLSTISVIDPTWRTQVEVAIQLSLNDYFKQCRKYGRVRLSNITLLPMYGQAIADVTLEKGYSHDGFFIDCSWFNCVFKGFMSYKNTTMQASLSVADIDSSLVNKDWNNIDHVAFKEKVISYFNNLNVKNKYGIPSSAKISISNIDISNIVNGEVSFSLNFSKYIDDNLNEQTNGIFSLTINNFAKYNSKVKVTANQVFNYGNEVDIATVTEEQIKAFVLKKVQAGEIFEGQFINKNSVSDLTANDLVITLNKDMNADSGKGQYTVTVSLKKEAAYSKGQQATQNLTTPSFIIKGFKLVETTMTSKKSFGYNELFSGDVPNLENFANGFENKIKAMIVSKQTTLFENLPDGGIAEANINIVDSNIKDYATYASGKLLINFTLDKIRPTTQTSKKFFMSITGFKKLETTFKSTKSFPLGDSSKYANDPSINEAWVKNKIIENKNTIFENLPKKVLPDGTTNWDLSKFLTVSNITHDPSNGEITFNVVLNNVYATGSQISKKVTFVGFKTDGITTELKSKTIDATSSEFKSIFTDQLANAFKEDFEKNKEKVKTSLINYINKNINTFFNDPSVATTVNDLDFTYQNNTLVVNSVTYVGKKGSNDSATITALNVSAWQILNLKSNPTDDEVIAKIKNELTNKIKNDINNPPAKIISKDVLVDELVNVLNSLKMSTDTWVGFPQTYLPEGGNFNSSNININKDQVKLPSDFNSNNLEYIVPSFNIGSITIPQIDIKVNNPENSSTNATITEAKNSPNVLAIVLGTLGGLVLLALLILCIALLIKRRNKYYDQYYEV